MATADAPNKAVDGDDERTHRWLERLSALVEQVDGWAKELDWSTRRIEKTMDDSRAGHYEAPALLLQKETVRIFLDPIAKAAAGAEGVVDLYPLPAYDDIATVFWIDDGWSVSCSPVRHRSRRSSGTTSRHSIGRSLKPSSTK